MGTISGDLPACVVRLCEAGIDRQKWLAGLHDLGVALNASGVAMLPRQRTYLALDLPMSPSLERFTQRFISEDWFRRCAKLSTLWNLRDTIHDVTVVTDFASGSEFASSTLFKELFLPEGTRWWTALLFHWNGEDYLLSIHRREDQGPFDDDDRTMLHQMRLQLVHPFVTCAQLAMVHDFGELYAFQRVNRAAAFLDRSGRIASSNDKMRRLDSEVGVAEERVFARGRDSNHELQNKISSALAKAISGYRGTDEPMLLHRDDRCPLVLNFFAASENRKANFSSAMLLLSIIDPCDRLSSAAKLGSRLFSLSPAESKLAERLSGGDSVRQAAARLEISYETARTQLKSIFQKANVRRQSDLVGLFMSLHD